MVSLKLMMHYECIRNVSDLLINLKEIVLCCEKDVLVHQTITHFAGISSVIAGKFLLTVIFRESTNNFDLLLYNEKSVEV